MDQGGINAHVLRIDARQESEGEECHGIVSGMFDRRCAGIAFDGSPNTSHTCGIQCGDGLAKTFHAVVHGVVVREDGVGEPLPCEDARDNRIRSEHMTLAHGGNGAVAQRRLEIQYGEVAVLPQGQGR